MIFERLRNWQFAFVVISAIGYWTTAFGETTSPSTDISNALPLITPDEPHLFLEVGSHFTLKCSAASSTNWLIVPGIKHGIRYSQGYYKTMDPRRPYGSYLELNKMSAKNVGYYYCVDNNYHKKDEIFDYFNRYTPFDYSYSTLESFRKVSKIYIFVQDFMNLLVPFTSYKRSSFRKTSVNITIPCKPTDYRNTTVELTEPIDQVQLFNSKEYHHTVGFTTFKEVVPPGVYVFYCKATSLTNGMESKSTFYLTFEDQEVTITSETNGQFTEGATMTLNCSMKNPRNNLEIIWDMPQNRSDPRIKISYDYSYLFEIYGKSWLIISNVTIEDTGIYNCSIKETESGNKSESKSYKVDVFGKPIVTINNTYIGVDKEATVVCKVEAVPEINEIFWHYTRCLWIPFWPNCTDERETLEPNRNVSNGIAQLTFKPQYPGKITCTASTRLGNTSADSEVLIGDVTGYMTVSGINNTSPLVIGTKVELTCAALVYYYFYDLNWYKNNTLVHEDNEITITSKLSDYSHKTSLTFESIQRHHSGSYECRARDMKERGRVSSRYLTVTVEKDENHETKYVVWTIAGVAILIVLLILLIISISYLYIRQRRAYYELRAAGLANFEKGEIDQINQSLGLHEQADLLPYDQKLEFPREKLHLGKQIGAGFFGVVLKASAEGIGPDGTETTVAVKMVKRNADNEVMKAIVSELKIMVHLGKHLNVVNLLGAVTKNILKRDVLVVVEYCKYGNVQTVLLKSRKRFIDQINPESDQIDRNVTVNSCAIGGSIRSAGTYDDAGENTTNSSHDQTSCVSSNIEGLEDKTIEITTTNLVSWAYQVASGMDYLSSRNILHGDLAARNILLCDDNIVKICDFGLARSMYGCEMYTKQEGARLPIKWLALESMSDHIFGTKTDVWSFGIVLWEFFSLATMPYPGMAADQSFYLKLKNGYRMSKPQYANAEIYDIMMQCWCENPKERPKFKDLELAFAGMCDEEMRNRLLVLNEIYQRKNTEHVSENTIDLLALAGSSDGATSSVMRNVNDNIKTNQNDGYMPMSYNSGNGSHTSNDQMIDGYLPPINFKLDDESPSLLPRTNINLHVQYVNDPPQPTVESFT